MNNRERAGRLLVEGLLIVVSILLAFAIDAAWAARGQRIEERQVLQVLQEEAAANQVLIDDVIRRTELDYATARGFFLAERQDLREADADLLQSLFRPNTTGVKMGALTSLTASGKLEIIKSADLRKLLLDWQGAATDLEERQRTLADLEVMVLREAGKHPELQAWFITRGRPNDAGQSEAGEANGSVDLRSVRSDQALLSGLAAMQFERRVHVLVLTQLRRRLDELMAALDQALGPA